MPFEPNRITQQHILDAVKRIEAMNVALKPSTKYDVIVNDKPYPPKEVLRYAHELVNGENLWEYPGGDPTNRYLNSLGFETRSKSEPVRSDESITVWKLGCNWGKGT